MSQLLLLSCDCVVMVNVYNPSCSAPTCPIDPSRLRLPLHLASGHILDLEMQYPAITVAVILRPGISLSHSASMLARRFDHEANAGTVIDKAVDVGSRLLPAEAE